MCDNVFETCIAGTFMAAQGVIPDNCSNSVSQVCMTTGNRQSQTSLMLHPIAVVLLVVGTAFVTGTGTIALQFQPHSQTHALLLK